MENADKRKAELQMASDLQPPAPYVFPFEKLDVWQMAVELADYVLGLLERIPLNKHFRLVSQMEGAVTSVSQNISEGKGRQYRKEFVQFLSIAQGSLYEVITLNEIFRRRGLFSKADSEELTWSDPVLCETYWLFSNRERALVLREYTKIVWFLLYSSFL